MSALLWLLACTAPSRFTDPAVLLHRELDADGSSGLDATELPSRDATRDFTRLDQDADGAVSVAELRGLMSGTGRPGAGPPREGKAPGKAEGKAPPGGPRRRPGQGSGGASGVPAAR